MSRGGLAAIAVLLALWVAGLGVALANRSPNVDRFRSDLEKARTLREQGESDKALDLIDRSLESLEYLRGADHDADDLVCDLQLEKVRILVVPDWEAQSGYQLRSTTDVLSSIGGRCESFLDPEQLGWLCQTLSFAYHELYGRERRSNDIRRSMDFMWCWVGTWKPEH